MSPEARVDGRRQRAQRSRERILDAVAEALRDPDIEITVPEVSARSGVSPSTIFRHFRDADGLSVALSERMAARVRRYLEEEPAGADALEGRVGALVKRRIALFEEIGPLLRAGSNAPGRRAHRRSQRAQLEGLLAAEARRALEPALAGLSRADSQAALEAVGVLLSVDGWAHLRSARGHGVRSAESILARAVLALVRAR